MFVQTFRVAACLMIAVALTGLPSNSARADDYTASGSVSYGEGPLGVDGVHVTGEVTWGVGDDPIQWATVVFKDANGNVAERYTAVYSRLADANNDSRA